jgi:hypothetical protein
MVHWLGEASLLVACTDRRSMSSTQLARIHTLTLTAHFGLEDDKFRYKGIQIQSLR